MPESGYNRLVEAMSEKPDLPHAHVWGPIEWSRLGARHWRKCEICGLVTRWQKP